jgi:UDP-N-acetylglucosamine 2-epimerase (non-hydrolysing)
MAESRVIDLVAAARPNFMKVAPVLRAMAEADCGLSARLVHTGQHYDAGMSDVFFRDLGIRPPDVHLGVGSGTHGAQTARVLAAYEEHLLSADPPPVAVVVVGDVNSTMACSLAAVKLEIPVVHVEAGLRSFDRSMPEEINRVVTDAVADLLLVSEPAGEENLRSEGVADSRVVYVGNVMIDTLMAELSEATALGAPADRGLAEGSYVYVTLHRPSNVDEAGRLGEVLGLLEAIASQLPVVFPVHPRTKKRLEEAGLWDRARRACGLQLLEPLSYRESLGLMASAKLVLTDSGGIQEETSVLGIPCLTLRPNTERPVTVSVGTNTVTESVEEIRGLVEDILQGRYKKGAEIPGWDGHAAERVVAALTERYGG